MAIQDVFVGIPSGLYKFSNPWGRKVLIKKFYKISGQRNIIRKL